MRKKFTTSKRSLPARQVAKDVLENIGKGKKLSMGQILKKNGYKPSVQKNPQLVTKSKSYHEVMDPFVAKMMKLRDALAEEMTSERRISTFKKEKLMFMSATMKNTVHDIQLLTGGKTDNIGLDELRNTLKGLIDDVK